MQGSRKPQQEQPDALTRTTFRSSGESSASDLSKVAIIWQVFYVFLLIVLSGVFLTSDQSISPTRPYFLSLVLLSVLLSIRCWSGALFLSFIQLNLLLTPGWGTVGAGGSGFIQWLLIPIGFIALVSRYRVLRDLNQRSERNLLQQAASAERSEIKRQWKAAADPIRNALWQLFRTGLVISVCAIAALLLMGFVPYPDGTTTLDPIQKFRIKPNYFRLLILGLSLFVVWLITWLVVNEIVWRKLSPRQASMYLRGTLLNWLHRDLGMVVRRRGRNRKTRSRTMKAREKNVRKTPTET